MTVEQIQAIVENRRFPGGKGPAQLIETHISWVILAADYVFKIKKPVQFPFLDFSTPEKRSFFCHEEVALNRRLAPEMYLGVLPIMLSDDDGLPKIGMAENSVNIDFAVWMRRMDERFQMDKLLTKNAVSVADVQVLAKKLAHFHRFVALSGNETN